MSDTCLSLVILTEDGSKNARATIEVLVRKMLPLVVPGCRLHDRVAFLPSEPREEEAMRGNAWKTDGKSKNPIAHERRVRLLRYIARRLCQSDTFVIFHIDGDRPWADRQHSENVAKFDRIVLSSLPQVVDQGRASTNSTKRTRETEPKAPEPVLHLDRLLLLCPFRSIEAWLYQNIQQAIVLCRRHHGGRHVDALTAWEEKRADFDELDPPEDAVCLRKDHNLELASQGFPGEIARAVGKSFAESLSRMIQCDDLRLALERTRDAQLREQG